MKCRVFFIAFIVPCLLAYGCNTMKGIEDDMSSLLEHMESGRQPSESAEGRNASADVSSSQSTGSVKQSKKENRSLTIRVLPEDSTGKVMNIRSRLSGHYGSVSSLCFSPDGHILAASAKDTIKIWKID